MSIEINELIVNAKIDESLTTGFHESRDDQSLNSEDIKAQIIAECKELFYELIDKQGDR